MIRPTNALPLRGLERGPRGAERPGGNSGLPDQLLGVKGGGLESLDRNERPENFKTALRNAEPKIEKDTKPGRENGDRTGREGERSVERDSDDKRPSKLRAETKSDSQSDRTSRKSADRRKPQDREDRRESIRDLGSEPSRDISMVERTLPREIVKMEEPGTVHESTASPSGMNQSTASPRATGPTSVTLPDFFSKTALSGGATPAMGTSVGNSAIGKEGNAAAESVLMMNQIRDEQVQTKAEAMAQFMEGMQQELGIPPEQILQAFSRMSMQGMSVSPEQSKQEFVGNLDLLPAQEGRASELYAKMLKTTGDAALSEKLAGMETGVNFEVMSRRDVTLKSLNKSLDDLNVAFFSGAKNKGTETLAVNPAQAQNAIETMDAELARLMRAGSGANQSPTGSDEGSAAITAADGFVNETDLSDSLEGDLDADLAGLEDEFGEALNEGGELGSEGVGSLATALAMGDASGQAGEGMSGQSQNGANTGLTEKVRPKSRDAENSFRSEMKSTDAADAKKANGETVRGDSLTAGTTEGALSSGMTPTGTKVPGQALAAGGPAAMMMGRQPTSQDEQENVRELIKQAQIVMKRGGGEMKLEMKPEGMGQVHLKVAVENGQVNVQMLTDNDQAKRLLEKGLSELRSSLAEHQLRVESMKVDIGQEIKKQMDQNGNQDASRESARQFAQDFMGGFRQDRNEFREGIMSGYGSRTPNRPQNRASVEPDSSISASSRVGAKSDGSRRLNLVA